MDLSTTADINQEDKQVVYKISSKTQKEALNMEEIRQRKPTEAHLKGARQILILEFLRHLWVATNNSTSKQKQNSLIKI
jgi:hypothetical protein